jgi:probable blue pigment (indigoidine) exporter
VGSLVSTRIFCGEALRSTAVCRSPCGVKHRRLLRRYDKHRTLLIQFIQYCEIIKSASIEMLRSVQVLLIPGVIRVPKTEVIPSLALMGEVNKNLRWVSAGILFAILWASASTATKIGLIDAQPMVIAEIRFAIASAIMLFVAHLIMKQPLPGRTSWRPLAIYGLLNITIYLGMYVIAMQTITAGIGSLGVASNPVFISFLSVFFLKKKLSLSIIISIIVCVAGVVCASWPLLENASVSPRGLLILLLSMVSYSVGAIYFARRQWKEMSLLTINGWQTLFGGVFLLPVTLLAYKSSANTYTQSFWLSVTWLAVPVSIFAVQLWLWLLRLNPIRAGLWLFLCPLFGFIIAALILKDVISLYTVIGVVLVIGGLLMSKLNLRK